MKILGIYYYHSISYYGIVISIFPIALKFQYVIHGHPHYRDLAYAEVLLQVFYSRLGSKMFSKCNNKYDWKI